MLLVGANEATCTVARQAAVACFVDSASPKQSGKQNGFGTQVVTKWWYAMVLSQAGFHLLFSDPDIVWLKDPFQHWDRSFDFQVRAPTLPQPVTLTLSFNPKPSPTPNPGPGPNRSFDFQVRCLPLATDHSPLTTHHSPLTTYHSLRATGY